MTSIGGNIKKRRGRPFAGTTPIHVRLTAPQLSALDAWIAEQPEPRPSRPEAMRRAATEHLRAIGYPPTAASSADHIDGTG